MKAQIAKYIADGARMDYPLYNISYILKGGSTRTVRRRATLRESVAFIKNFDRVYCGQGELIKDVESVYLEPVREVKVHETGEIIPL